MNKTVTLGKHKGAARRATAGALGAVILLSVLCSLAGVFSPVSAAAEGAAVTHGVERHADPSTMDTYTEMLDLSGSTRDAGRLWTDKSVFAYGKNATAGERVVQDNALLLNPALDGVTGTSQTIPVDADFLEVFSALGSSQRLSQNIPIDLIVGMDITHSMLRTSAPSEQDNAIEQRKTWKGTLGDNGGTMVDSNLARSLVAANGLFRRIYQHSPDSRISVVVYWGSGYQLIPWYSGLIQFTGYSVRCDRTDRGPLTSDDTSRVGTESEQYQPFASEGSADLLSYRAGLTEAVFHYTVTDSEGSLSDGSSQNGDYVYDPVYGTIYKYPLGGAPEHDLSNENIVQKKRTWNGQSNKWNSWSDSIKCSIGKITLQNGGEDITDKVQAVGTPALCGGTGLEGGIYTTMSAVRNVKDDVTFQMIDGSTVTRIPAVVILGDGNTNHVLVKAGDPDAARTGGDGQREDTNDKLTSTGTSGDWWNPDTDSNKEGDQLKSAATSGDRNAVADFNAVLQAAYWKAAIHNVYNLGSKETLVYTIGLAANPPCFDPANFFLKEDAANGQNKFKTYQAYLNWQAGTELPMSETSTELGFKQSGYTDGKVLHIQSNAASGYDTVYAMPYSLARPAGTIYNYNKLPETGEPFGVKMSDLNLNYPKQYFGIDSKLSAEQIASQLDGIFDDIGEEIVNSALFAPVNGKNSLGVADSVTFMDPLGKYMEVKEVKSLLLFGKVYPIVRTAVYDYAFNQAVDQSHKEGDLLKEGWYKGEATSPDLLYGGAKDLPSEGGYSSDPGALEGERARAWADGWVYRLNAETAAAFVPSIAGIDSESGASEKMRQTEYTFYRVNLEETEREATHLNPAYGEDPGSAPQEGLPGVYKLSDLRIWTEDTGDYNDALFDEGELVTNTGYDRALWIDLPSSMIPLRTVTLTQAPGGDWSYTTNLDETDPGHAASFPLRVFYTVGVEESLLTEARNINTAALSAEYTRKNKVNSDIAAVARGFADPADDNPDQSAKTGTGVGYLELFSNWWGEENRYGNFPTSGTEGAGKRTTYSYGDATVTFSPADANRYYLFEAAKPLYKSAKYYDGSAWQDVNISSGDDELLFEEQAKRAYEVASLENVEHPQQGDVVFLEKDRLSDVEVKEGVPDPFPSSGHYFFTNESFTLNGTAAEDGSGKKAEQVTHPVVRQGSEFGSGYPGFTNGEMLCWVDLTDESGGRTSPYLSYSDTGDPTRGKAYIGLTQSEIDSLKDENGKIKPLAEDDPLLKKHEAAVGEGHNWVLATRRGGMRIGALAQAMGLKSNTYDVSVADGCESLEGITDRFLGENLGGDTVTVYDAYKQERFPDKGDDFIVRYYAGNITRTSNSYYMPTIGHGQPDESGEHRPTVNTYLGNNGRLVVADSALLLTKTVKAPSEGLPVDGKREFHFQVYIEGREGRYDGIVVKWVGEHWQRQIRAIDLLLDARGFLLTTDGSKAMVDERGALVVQTGTEDGAPVYEYADPALNEQPVTTPVYYICTGDGRETESPALRLYKNDDPFIERASEGEPEVSENIEVADELGGAQTFSLKENTATLYTPQEYEALLAGGDPSAPVPETKLGADLLLLTLTPASGKPTDAGTVDALSITEPKIDTPFSTTSDYWTQGADFGGGENGVPPTPYDAEPEGLEDIQSDRSDLFGGVTTGSLAANTAEVKLRGGYGLLFPGIPLGSTYRVTEKLTEDDIGDGYRLLEMAHNQQFGSLNTYEVGSNKFTDLGEVDPPLKPEAPEAFGHSNARLVTSYATFYNGQTGNHHEPGDGGNPACYEGAGGVDEKIGNDIRHYFVKDGELVDKHYAGEEGAFQNNRYVVGVTAHFTDDGAYSAFGNTGVYEEGVHYVNTYVPDALAVDKILTSENGNYPLSDADRTREFTFTVTFTLPGGEHASGSLDGAHYWKGENVADAPRVDAEEIKNLPTLSNPTSGEIVKEESLNTFTFTYTFTLTDGQTIVFYDLPIGTTYTVTETKNNDYPIQGDTPENTQPDLLYIVTNEIAKSDPNGTEFFNAANFAHFANVKPTPQTGTLSLQKALQNEVIDPDTLFTFTISLTVPTAGDAGYEFNTSQLTVTKLPKQEGVTFALTWGEPTTDETGRVTYTTDPFDLRQNEEIVLSGIPFGSSYTITETKRPGYNLQYVVEGDSAENPDALRPEIARDPVTGCSVSGEIVEDTHAIVKVIFVNAKAPVIPTTGGLGGRWIFLAAGALCLLSGAGIVLLLRRRASRRPRGEQ